MFYYVPEQAGINGSGVTGGYAGLHLLSLEYYTILFFFNFSKGELFML